MAEPSESAAQRRPVPEELGRALLSHMAPWRPQSLSLHDGEGEALWLSGGSIGPDEHGYVASALEVFTLEPRRACQVRRLEDGRRAIFLAARDPLGGCSGIAFVPIEHAVADESKIVTAAVRALLQRYAMLLAPKPAQRAAAAPPAQGGDTTEAKLPADAPIHARQYARLQPGAGTRRYEIAISPAGTAHDAAVVERVTMWVAQHRQRYLARPASFTIAISAQAATDPQFAQRVLQACAQAELEEGTVILSVPAEAWAAQPRGLGPLIEACDRSGCHLMLEDFEMREAGLELLRHKAVRMLKLLPSLTASAMDDRYSRALLASCLQIARVLGIHCVARGVADAAASRWLAGAGVDFADPLSASPAASATGSGEAPALMKVS